jgi:predicted ATPase/DNA-binding XRE family transcriptional regulator
MNKKPSEDLSFGQWLRQQRRMLDLTQQELADQLGCARITLRRIEADALKPSKELAVILLEKLGTPSTERESWLRFARGLSEFPESQVDSTSKPPTNFPATLTSFIGREKEQAEILKLVDQHRLVTLIGLGGVGKTRLSLKIGELVLGDYADGVWLVELAPILDPLLVPRTTAIAIGLHDEPQRPVIDMLSDYLHKKRMLIVLDNCEHLLDACAQLSDRLLKSCPNLKILATSREALGILGEAIYHVPSLGLPDLPQILERFRDYESVRLFEERAQLVQLEFSLTMENAPSVAKICNELDGIPLAIELAAAHVGTFSTEQIAARLQKNFNLLTTGNRTALPRHQTLRAAIDWSYDLLSPAEQILFQRLSVFVNGWTFEAAESICSDVNIKSKDVLDLLVQLVKKSLVNTYNLQGVTRYRVLETIRQYASEKLVESGQNDIVGDKHLEYFLNLAETAEPYLRRAEQIEWLNRLDAEVENLRAALVWAMNQPTAGSALKLAGALGAFWSLRGSWLDGASLLDQVLSKAWDKNNDAEKAARARALYRRINLAHQMDQDVRPFAELALALSQVQEDRWGTAYSRAALGYSLWRTGNPKASKPLLDQSLSEFHNMGDDWGEAMVSLWMAGASILLGMQDEYFKNRQRALDYAHRSGDRELIAILLRRFIADLISEGNWEHAENMLQETEQLYTAAGFSPGENETCLLRARLLFGRTKPDQAKTEAKQCLERCVHAGEKNLQAKFLLLLGLIAEFENDLPNAEEYIQRGVELIRELGQPEFIWWNITLARLKYIQGDSEIAKQSLYTSLMLMKNRDMLVIEASYIFHHIAGLVVKKKTQVAVQFLSLSADLRQRLVFIRDPTFDKPYSERFRSTARAKLSENQFTVAWEVGLRMKIEDGLELAWKTVDEM